jgi:two-component system sensor histidine kinase RpfC
MLLTSFYRRIFTTLTDQSQRWLTRDGLKAMFAVARGTELEQGGLRVLIGGLVLAYLAWYVLRDGQIRDDEGEVLAVAVGFFVFAVALALRILTAPHISVARRFLGMIADNAVTTYCLIRMGEGAAVVLFVYLFITFGNGFRFGRVYLRACQLMNLAGFTLVLLLSRAHQK